MTISLLVGLVSIALAIGLGVYLLAAGRTASAATSSGVAVSVATPMVRGAGADRTGDPTQMPALYRRLGSIAARLSPADYAQRLQRRLDRAGNPRNWAPDRVLAFKGLGLVAGLLLGALFGVKQGGPGVLAFPAALGTFGLFLPNILINNIGQKRQTDLQRGLPDAMDMLTVCVEAGLGFDAAMSRVARNLKGPIAGEFARVLQEMQFGLSRIEALRLLAERTDLPELRRLVSAIVQSSELGISIGGVLREQSQDMRIRRRQRAEEKAQKLQVKILMPLISCLLPAMFIVILGPAIINIMGFFKGVN